MTVKHAAARLEVSPSLVYSLVSSGKLRHYRIGNGRGCIRIAEDHIAEFLGNAEPAKLAPAPISRVRLKHINL